ncbi:substrate-binding domain-containing protein [Streptomyces stelliscabiei]
MHLGGAGGRPGLHRGLRGHRHGGDGALAALREAGLDVPGDISLIGFDDVPFAAGLSPALTTVRVPYEDLGRAAVRLALEREERRGGDDHVVLGTQLVIRQSVRTPS